VWLDGVNQALKYAIRLCEECGKTAVATLRNS